MGRLRLKRVYEPAAPGDGSRVLVDRLWPRGVSRKAAKLDLWLKEIAPSTELRTWFGHEPARFDAFRERYFRELEGNPAPVAELCALVEGNDVTLLYGAHDPQLNQAVVLAEFLEKRGCRREG